MYNWKGHRYSMPCKPKMIHSCFNSAYQAESIQSSHFVSVIQIKFKKYGDVSFLIFWLQLSDLDKSEFEIISKYIEKLLSIPVALI